MLRVSFIVNLRQREFPVTLKNSDVQISFLALLRVGQIVKVRQPIGVNQQLVPLVVGKRRIVRDDCGRAILISVVVSGSIPDLVDLSACVPPLASSLVCGFPLRETYRIPRILEDSRCRSSLMDRRRTISFVRRSSKLVRRSWAESLACRKSMSAGHTDIAIHSGNHLTRSTRKKIPCRGTFFLHVNI